jgi:hypothetical protein
MLTFMVTVLFRTSFSIPPNWSNIAFSLAVTSSSYDGHREIETGAAGASAPFNAAGSSGAELIMAIHSLRVIS